MSARLSAVLLVVLAGCAPVPSARPAVHSPALAPRAPATVAWEEVSREPGRLEARIRVLRSGAWSLPLQVRVALPEGVRALSGRTEFEVGADVREHVELLQFSTGDGPPRPLVVHLDGVLEGAGLHAEARLPETDPTVLVPTGPVLRWGGCVLGPVVSETPGPSTPANLDTGLQ